LSENKKKTEKFLHCLEVAQEFAVRVEETVQQVVQLYAESERESRKGSRPMTENGI
jgi:hypothetical protein